VAIPLLPLALNRETLIESALAVLGAAAVVVAWGAVMLFRRERRGSRTRWGADR
jgi:hypothetical protein